jgi:hypothetical protein
MRHYRAVAARRSFGDHRGTMKQPMRILGGAWCFALASFGCGGPESTSAAESESDEPLSQQGSALDPCLPPLDLDGQCVHLNRLSGAPYLHAPAVANTNVATSTAVLDLRTWCFSAVPDPIAPTGVFLPGYTVQHQTFSGQFLDAYESSGNDYRVVLRNEQGDATQRWVPEMSCESFHLFQESSGRYLDAYTGSQMFRAVTRSFQTDGTQSWTVE